MWNKLILFSCLIAVLVLISHFFQQNDQGPQANRSYELSRQASGVVMFERKRTGGKTLEVSAREADETGNLKVLLKDFQVTDQSGLRLSGDDATYDRVRSILDVKGPVSIETQDGSRARLNGLVWDRDKNFAYTDNPVMVEGKDGIITAERAEFFDGFSDIVFMGRVHAKIIQNILDL
jgi:hypothetical protein